MGTLWGLMIEAVDPNCSLQVEGGDGVLLLKEMEVVLRVCDPPIPTRIMVRAVPADIGVLKATLRVGDDAQVFFLWLVEWRGMGADCLMQATLRTAERVLSPPTDGPSVVDEVCASEAIVDLQAEAFEEMAKALAVRDFDKAADANTDAVTAIERLFDFELVPEEVKQAIVFALKELEDQAQYIARSREDHDVAREAELRALSRSATTRNGGASLDPEGRTLSELQSQLSVEA